MAKVPGWTRKNFLGGHVGHTATAHFDFVPNGSAVTDFRRIGGTDGISQWENATAGTMMKHRPHFGGKDGFRGLVEKD